MADARSDRVRRGARAPSAMTERRRSRHQQRATKPMRAHGRSGTSGRANAWRAMDGGPPRDLRIERAVPRRARSSPGCSPPPTALTPATGVDEWLPKSKQSLACRSSHRATVVRPADRGHERGDGGRRQRPRARRWLPESIARLPFLAPQQRSCGPADRGHERGDGCRNQSRSSSPRRADASGLSCASHATRGSPRWLPESIPRLAGLHARRPQPVVPPRGP